MTQIVGNVLDVGLDGASGTITVWAGFRPEATALIAPRRKTYDIVGGVIPDGVEVAPGPVHIEIDMGLNAYDSISVTVPDQATVTIQDLYLQGYVWQPYVITQVAEDRERAEAAANRAEAAADDVDAAITDAASQVIADVEADRVAAEAARAGAEDARDAAAGSASDAAAFAATAGDQATLAGERADDAGAARDAAAGSASAAAGSASDAASSASDAAGSATAAASSASDAAGSASVAAGHASAAGTDADRARQYAEDFGLSMSAVTGDPGTPAQVVVSGDGPAYEVALTVPQGEKGDPGPPGEVSQAALDAALAGKADLVDGKVPESQLPELGGSTDASLLTGALTTAVDITNGAVYSGGQPIGTLWDLITMLALADHTHTVADIDDLPIATKPGTSTPPSAPTTGATAIGWGATAGGARSVAIGQAATGNGGDAIALGNGASATGTSSVAIGEGASAVSYGVAIGEGASTTGIYGVAIGQGVTAAADEIRLGHSYHTTRIPGKLEVGGRPVSGEWTGSQAQYDALGSYDPNVTYYVIEE